MKRRILSGKKAGSRTRWLLSLWSLSLVIGIFATSGIARADEKIRGRAARGKAAVAAIEKKGTGKTPANAGEKPVLRSAGKDTRGENVKTGSNYTAGLRAKYFLDKPLKTFKPGDRGQVLARLETLRKKPVTQRFLNTIQKAEDGGPNVMVGRRYKRYGNVCIPPNLDRHPGEVLPLKCFYWSGPTRHRVFSTASGNYQITRQNWRAIAPFLALNDFSPANQQRAALELIRRGGGARSERVKLGFLELEKGRINGAIRLATQDWASSIHSSLPSNVKTDYRGTAEKIRLGKIRVNNGLDDEKRVPKNKVVRILFEGPKAKTGQKNRARR